MSSSKGIENFECRECGKKYDTRRSLHSHLKAHKMFVGDYYVKHFPKKDLLTGEQIPFVTLDKYVESSFRNNENMEKWFGKTSEREAKSFISAKMNQAKERGHWKVAPCVTEVFMRGLPSIHAIARLYGSYFKFCRDELKLPMMFPNRLPQYFFDEPRKHTIAIDTREQRPLEFEDSVRMTMKFGDYKYTDDYGGSPVRTVVERKSEGDLIGTVTVGHERFVREIERVVDAGFFMFVVVESGLLDFETANEYATRRANIPYVFHQIKGLQRKYYNNIQFVFSGSRKWSEYIVPRLLRAGEDAWKTDIQFFLDWKKNQIKIKK
jgi:hypothetical protein